MYKCLTNILEVEVAYLGCVCAGLEVAAEKTEYVFVACYRNGGHSSAFKKISV